MTASDRQNQSNPDAAVPRCLKCGYRLDHLTDPRCPECGQPFNPADPATVSWKPPFLFWRYWMPGVLLAFVSGLIIMFAFAVDNNIGWGATVGVPTMIGCLLGYGIRLSIVALVFLAMLTAFAVVTTLVALHPAAFFCGVILGVIFLVPAGVGAVVGFALRCFLKMTRFSQRSHLPMLLLLLLPFAIDRLERAWMQPLGVERVETRVVLPMSADRAWSHMMYYEEVRHAPPLLLRLGIAQPTHTQGQAAAVGDVKVCHYQNGRLVKRVTDVEPAHRLTFEVIEQHRVESHSVRLQHGEFRFDPIDDHRVAVTLVTEYEPLLRPRFAWRAVERLGMHTLHEHVIEGIRREAQADAAIAPLQIGGEVLR